MASDAKVEDKPADKAPESKTIAQGEDDEFEDFPVDGACFPSDRAYRIEQTHDE